MMNEQMVRDLSAQVQRNCHISDARHSGDYAMCTYLMKMREYYRWECGLPFGALLPREAVGAWLAQREQLWESLAGDDYAALAIDGGLIDPFNAEAVNRRLAPRGLVYSAGLGRNAKPHFFLGALTRHEEPEGCSVLISGREYARDLGAPPAMTQGHTIYIRRESLRRMLWERLEGWRWNRPDNALGRAFACYELEIDLEGALEAMTDCEIRAALLHETGEYRAGLLLGEGWNDLVLALSGTPAELMARAVRDHLADCLVTLPALVAAGEEAPIHFYLGNLTHMRREIFPALAGAYQEWLASGSQRPLEQIAARGREHWEELAQGLLRVAGQTAPAPAVMELVGDAYL
jgi:Family of unknown function (DUF6866) C-terminal domain/Family of unknown function (DUF6866) N-terminal domain